MSSGVAETEGVADVVGLLEADADWTTDLDGAATGVPVELFPPKIARPSK
jgi:hypothetical protein